MSNKNQITSHDPGLRITFSGLCSFVDARGEDKKGPVYVLLVAARQANVDPPLGRHHRYLIFRATECEYASDVFYKCFAYLDPKDGKPNTLCLWNLDHCEVQVAPILNPPLKDPIEFCPEKKILDLTKESPVDRRWLQDTLRPVGLVGTRFKLRHGKISVGTLTKDKWVMCHYGEEEVDIGPAQKIAQTVNYDIFGSAEFFEISAYNYETGRHHILQLHSKSEVFVSNLAPLDPRDRSRTEERDVYAYYDLSIHPLPQDLRCIPRFKIHTPRQSACPPAIQLAEV